MQHMIRRTFTTAAVALGLTLAAGAVQAADLTIPHASGETTLAAVPQKVFVYDLAALDILDALGVPVAGVPTGNKPSYLVEYTDGKVLEIGSFFEPNYETVNAEEPDLVIVGGRSAAKYADLARMAPTIDLTVPAEKYVEGTRDNTLLLGRLFGKEAEAASLVERLDVSIAALRTAATNAGPGLLVLTTGGKMSAYGPGSRFGVIHDTFGIPAAAPGLQIGNHGQPISHEFVLETNPDWLFVIDRDAGIGRDGQAAQQFLDNDIVRRTTAWQKGQVVYLNPLTWYLVGTGIQAAQQNVDAIAAALTAARTQ